jgi:hypothetical protein
LSQPVSILTFVKFKTSITAVSEVPVVVEIEATFCATGEVSAALMVQVVRFFALNDRGIRYRYFEGAYQIIIKYSFRRTSWHGLPRLRFFLVFLSYKANARV